MLPIALCAAALVLSEPPAARLSPATDTHHGELVADPYRWLEDGSSQEVQGWSDAQNAHARAILDALPHRADVRERVAQIEHATSAFCYGLSRAPSGLFALKHQPPLQQDLLVLMGSPDAPETQRVIVDPNALDPSGGTTIDWYHPSPDGLLVAVSLSRGGSESGDVHVYDVATATPAYEVIERVNGGTAGGDLAWTPDSKGFYYTRYPREGERQGDDVNFYQQLYHHTLGASPSTDRYEMGRDLDRISEIQVEVEPTSGRVLAAVQYGDGGTFAFYLRGTDGAWTKIIDYADQVVQATFAGPDALFLISHHRAPRGRVLRLPLSTPTLDRAAEIVPEGDDTIVADFWPPSPMVVTPQRLYLTYQLGGPSEVRVFDHAGRPLASPALAPVSSVKQIVPAGEDVLVLSASYIEPPAYVLVDHRDGSVRKTGLGVRSPVDFSDTEVVREFATSADGTRVPVNIVRRKGTRLDGTNPTILYGYGGYGVNIEPGFNPLNRVWIEQGGVYAVANIRGGSEFGKAWHEGGRLTRKQNVFDDFAAAMRHLIDTGYTSPDRLGILGGSNGGLLMGAMLTQHPDLFRATVSHVGIYDMLRVELSPNGAFNVPEFGTVKDPEQYRALRAYSPYHNVKKGVDYPAVLFMTGANDPRVDPMQSRKMTALLQASNPGGRPVLLRTSAGTGHGQGTPLDEAIEQDTDQFTFFFDQLGVSYQPVRE